MTGAGRLIESGPYAGYRIVVGDEFSEPVYYDEAAVTGVFIRVHYRVSRLPAEKTIVLRHLSGSTDADRKNALIHLDRLGAWFRNWEQQDAVHRVRWRQDPRKWLFYAFAGTRVDDPLVQLELEMMIDLDQSASLHPQELER